MKIINELKQRGIFNNITNEEKFAQLKQGEAVYIGFDPTAKSLHLGNYLQIVMLLRFKEAGFKPIAVLGGATGMIGDPSGKSAERNLLDSKELDSNKEYIKKQLESFGLEVIDNYDFYKDMNVLTFLREVGKLLNVNYMINKDVVASRLETGISFTEFSYQLIQGWDFKELYDKHNVKVQIGGSDQWGNITSGVEIIRKTNGDDNTAVGITTNLLTTASGKKFGKTEGNAIWLDKTLTTPFQLYQYILNTPDEDLEKIMKWTTLLPLEEIENIMKEHSVEPFKRKAQICLAQELVKDIHSPEELEEAENLSSVLFGQGDIKSLTNDQKMQLKGSVPSFENIHGTLFEVLTQVGAIKSNREGREFVSSGAIQINGEVISDENYSFASGVYLIKKGKKKFFLIKN